MGLARKIGGSDNDARRDYRHNLDQQSNKKDEDKSGGQSSQQPVKLVGGKADAKQKIQQTDKKNPVNKGNLSNNNQNQPKVKEITSDQENKAPEVKAPEEKVPVAPEVQTVVEDKTPVVPEVQTVVPEDKTPEVQNPEKSNDVIEPAIQSNNEVDDKKNEIINPQDTQDNANNIDQPAELNDKTEEEPVLPQGDNQNKSEVETPVAPEAETPDKIPDESNNVISNQQQIQSNANQEQNNNIPINDSKPAIQQKNNKTVANKPPIGNQKRNRTRMLKNSGLTNGSGARKFLGNIDKEIKKSFKNNKTVANKPPIDNQKRKKTKMIKNSGLINGSGARKFLGNIDKKIKKSFKNNKTVANKLSIGNQKRKRVEVGAKMLKNSSLINGSGARKFLGNIDKGIEKSFGDPSNVRMQEFAMNADSKQIQTLKNNMKIQGAKEEKEFNQNMLKAAQAYQRNNDLKNRDLQDLVNDYKTTEEEAQGKMNETYKASNRTFHIACPSTK